MRPGLKAAVLLGALVLTSAPGGASPRFVPVDPTAFAGITSIELPGGGVALADVDGDGHDDVLAVRAGAGVELRYTDPAAWRLRARGPAPAPAGAGDAWRSMSVAAADVDGDGRVDLLLGATDRAYLLFGRGDGGFDDRTALAFDGLSRPVASFALADVDGDGRLDVHLVTYLLGADWPHARCAADALFLQREEAWVRADLPDAAGGAGCGFGAVWFDQDGDGDADAWVANDFGPFTVPSHVWRNDGVDAAGRLRLRDAQDAVTRPVATYAMGVAVGDVDADGLLDVASSSIGRAPLHRALGGGRFDDQSETFGTSRSLGRTGTRLTWGVVLADLDGDGTTDLFEAGGYFPLDPLLDARPGGSPTLFYAGGRPPWTEDTDAFAEHTVGGDYRGVAAGDLDGDGAPDLALAGAVGTSPLVLRNASPGGPWLGVVPRGTVSPREARGAVVTLACGGRANRTDVVPTGGNPGSMSAPRAYVSLAGCDRARATLLIDWPSGVRSSHPVPPTAVAVVEEPRWLTVDRPALLLGGDASAASATIAVVPRDARGPLGGGQRVEITPLTANAVAGPVTADATGTYRSTVTARAAGEAWFAVAINGRTLPRRVRLPVRASPPTSVARATPGALSPSRPVDAVLVPRRPGGEPWGAGHRFAVAFEGATGAPLADDRGAGCYVARAELDRGRTAPVVVRVTAPDGAVTELRVPVVPDLDAARTVADLRPAVVAAGERPEGPTSVLATLFSPLGDPIIARSQTPPHLFDARGNDLGAGRVAASSSWSFAIDDGHTDDGPFTLRVGSEAVAAELARRAAPSREALAAEVSAATSRLDPMEATLEADGVASTGLVLRLADGQGRVIALPGVRWEVEGGALDEAASYAMDGSVVRRVVVGARPGTLSARVRVRDDLTLATTIALVAPRAEAVTSLELCVSGSILGGDAVALYATAFPRAANGLLAGGNRDVTLALDDAPTAVTADRGAYTTRWLSHAPGRQRRLRAIDRGSLVPARAAAALEAALELPLGAPGDPAAWQGELRCVTARVPVVPSDAAVPAVDGSTEAPPPRGLGCRAGTSHASHDRRWLLTLAACLAARWAGSGRRRQPTRRRAGAVARARRRGVDATQALPAQRVTGRAARGLRRSPPRGLHS